MTSTSFNIKPPEKYFSARPNNFARPGKSIPTKNNADFISQYSINFTIKQNNKFESIFNSFSSKMLKNSAKSERKPFKPLSALEITHIKLKSEQEGQNRKQRSLQSILFSHREDQTERKEKRRPSSRYRPKTAQRCSKSPTYQVENKKTSNETKRMKTEAKSDQKFMLQSTNFTVRSYFWQNANLNDVMQKPIVPSKKNSFLHSSMRSSKRGQTNKSNLLHRQDLKKSLKDTKQNEQHEIEIRLSLKSMSKSQQGEKQIPQARTTMEKWIMEENKRLREIDGNQIKINAQKARKQLNPQQSKRHILAGTTYKQNRMILKFDKRMLKNITQINDPCLKVSKISTISSRIKTQTVSR